MDKARLQKPSLWCEALPAAWFNHKDGILHSFGHALVAPWPNHWFCLKTIFCDILCVSMVIESQSTVCSRSFIDATWCNLISASCAGWPRTAYALELHRVHYLWVRPRASINDLMTSLWATKLILVWGWPTESGSTLSLGLTWILSSSCLMFFLGDVWASHPECCSAETSTCLLEAEALQIVLPMRPDMLLGLEQPAQSWGFKIPCMLQVKALACLNLVPVWNVFGWFYSVFA